uniref:Uncharacterized protein n=1 Tax=Lepeophtheirus salmonis TaxID=72036 RepID=A0A0K2US52_LEPSM
MSFLNTISWSPSTIAKPLVIKK